MAVNMKRARVSAIWIGIILLVPIGLQVYYVTSDYMEKAHNTRRLIREYDHRLDSIIKYDLIRRENAPEGDRSGIMAEIRRTIGKFDKSQDDRRKELKLPRGVIFSWLFLLCYLSIWGIALCLLRDRTGARG